MKKRLLSKGLVLLMALMPLNLKADELSLKSEINDKYQSLFLSGKMYPEEKRMEVSLLNNLYLRGIDVGFGYVDIGSEDDPETEQNPDIFRIALFDKEGPLKLFFYDKWPFGLNPGEGDGVYKMHFSGVSLNTRDNLLNEGNVESYNEQLLKILNGI